MPAPLPWDAVLGRLYEAIASGALETRADPALAEPLAGRRGDCGTRRLRDSRREPVASLAHRARRCA
jgi:hypothetical protein